LTYFNVHPQSEHLSIKLWPRVRVVCSSCNSAPICLFVDVATKSCDVGTISYRLFADDQTLHAVVGRGRITQVSAGERSI